MATNTTAVAPISGNSAIQRTDVTSMGGVEPRLQETAQDLAQAFSTPQNDLTGKVPAIANALQDFADAKTSAQAVDAFKNLADLLGIQLPQAQEKSATGGPEGTGSGSPTEGTGQGGMGEEELVEMIKKLISLFGVDKVKNMLKALGLGQGQVDALLNKAGVETASVEKGSGESAAESNMKFGSAQFNRG